ncbi:efflux RND transporter periplasmic adaptor subunit [Oscillibacter valericigenes]|uniref:efflux RND transporter periplasmic adaptor subunit n=1 Tax=Oscillibacter valericigenes TaxID=351091 RepID=UPI001F2AFEAA|nr:efflux RND transporter periplasmic adaptor subunit [Oscillibacter valericigenes]MCF2616966.1 efflux RND transporter periplasmic adaptor subunit [Oscillibacter valericigenes]
MKYQKLFAGLLAAAMTLALTACGSKEPEEETPAAEGIAVQVQTVTANTISTENKVSGQVSADNASTILIASAAKCTAVYKNAGDQVQAGEKICTLDLGSTLSGYNAARISYQAAVQSYQDQKSILDKQVSMAQDNVNNTKALFEIGAASQLEVDQAELNYENAVAGRNSALSQLEAGIQNAKSGVEQLDTALDNVDANGNVLAPQSGTLVTMNAVEGSYISNSMPLVVIDGADQMKVTASVSEALVPKLTVGDKAEVSVSAADATFTATIRSVERAASMQTKLYTVVLTVPADVGGLMSGMFADVTFRTDTAENTIVVPTEAILTSNHVQYVFVVEDGAAKYVEVTTGLTGSGVTEVTSGLTEGEQLVTVGQAYLSDGDPVRVVSGEE